MKGEGLGYMTDIYIKIRGWPWFLNWKGIKKRGGLMLGNKEGYKKEG